MKVLLHGANNLNFGDNLFSYIFYKTLIEDFNVDACFVEFPRIGIKKKLSDEISYKKQHFDFMFADKLVYFSGGYFGEKTSSIKEAISRFFRYCLIGKLYCKKPIAIIGVGVGPISQKWLRKAIIKIVDSAEWVVVRDQESKNYLESYGIKKEIIVSTDTALLLKSDNLPLLHSSVSKLIKKRFDNKHLIFWHIAGFSSTEIEKLINAFSSFLNDHDDYGIICGVDGFPNKSGTAHIDTLYKKITSRLEIDNVFFYPYDGALQFCSLLNNVDFIVTGKLHVGIVGSALNKSVVSFPHHSKIQRFFKQIGYEERCIEINNLNWSEIKNAFERYYNEPIKIPELLRESANNNLRILKCFINNSGVIGEGNEKKESNY